MKFWAGAWQGAMLLLFTRASLDAAKRRYCKSGRKRRLFARETHCLSRRVYCVCALRDVDST